MCLVLQKDVSCCGVYQTRKKKLLFRELSITYGIFFVGKISMKLEGSAKEMS